MANSILSGVVSAAEAPVENKLRPLSLAEYVGQDKVKANLQIAVEAARRRKMPLDHILLYGPPGLGKTTLAQILANEMGSRIRVTAGPLLGKKGDLQGILTSMKTGDIFFLDEIHRLPPAMEEVLYPAMEDFRIDLILGEGQLARVHPYPLDRFTMVGATTRAGMISSPLRARFGIVLRLSFYSSDDLARIVKRSAALLGVGIDDDGANEIALRSRGTPRVANRLLCRARDYADVRANGTIDRAVSRDALAMFGVDEHGLDELDRSILRSIIKNFGGGPVGLGTVAASVNEDEGSVEDMCEPYLMEMGLLSRTPRGRSATPMAYTFLGMKPPKGLSKPRFN